MKFEKLTEEQKELLKENGIAHENYMACYEDEKYLHIIQENGDMQSVKAIKKRDPKAAPA